MWNPMKFRVSATIFRRFQERRYKIWKSLELKINLKYVERTTCNFNSEMFNKNKNKKYHAVGPIPKFNLKIVERRKIDTPNTQIHDGLISWLCTDASLKSDRTNVVFPSPHHLYFHLSHRPHQCLMFISLFGFIVLVN